LSTVAAVIGRWKRPWGKTAACWYATRARSQGARDDRGTDEHTIRGYAEEIVATMQKALAQ